LQRIGLGLSRFARTGLNLGQNIMTDYSAIRQLTMSKNQEGRISSGFNLASSFISTLPILNKISIKTPMFFARISRRDDYFLKTNYVQRGINLHGALSGINMLNEPLSTGQKSIMGLYRAGLVAGLGSGVTQLSYGLKQYESGNKQEGEQEMISGMMGVASVLPAFGNIYFKPQTSRMDEEAYEHSLYESLK